MGAQTQLFSFLLEKVGFSLEVAWLLSRVCFRTIGIYTCFFLDLRLVVGVNSSEAVVVDSSSLRSRSRLTYSLVRRLILTGKVFFDWLSYICLNFITENDFFVFLLHT